MSKRNDGGPAFPSTGFINYDESVTRHERSGMSVRTYIATEALAALIVACSRDDGPAMDADAITDAAVLYADGLIEALNEGC